MTKRDKGTFVGIIAIFLLIAYSKGIAGLWNMIKHLAEGMRDFGMVLLALVTHFPDELGITDWLWTRGIYVAICLVAAIGIGYAFSAKEKKKLLATISVIIGLISGVCAFM